MVPISTIELAVLSLAESSVQMQTVLARGLAILLCLPAQEAGPSVYLPLPLSDSPLQ